MNGFINYLDEKIVALQKEAEFLSGNFQSDECVFVKIKCNVYEICKTVYFAFKKAKPAEQFYEEYKNKLAEFEESWKASKELGAKFGDAKKVATEDAKLIALLDIKQQFEERRDL